jgi:uncharacterized protein
MLRYLFATLFILIVGPVSAACQVESVQLRGEWGETHFSVEIADTPETRSRGLMFRDAMPRGDGMLFVHEEPRHVSFWMKNTLIPLDMLFVDRTGTITRIHHQAIPGNLTAIDGGDHVFAVLEINGGLAKRYGISVGSQMQHDIFSNGPAVWPC